MEVEHVYYVAMTAQSGDWRARDVAGVNSK